MKHGWLMLLCACGSTESFALTVPADVKSVLVFVIDQNDRGGASITCEALLAPDVSPYAERVRLLKRPRVVAFSDSTIRLDDIPPGKNRIFYLEAFDGANGEGNQLGRACSEGHTIERNDVAEIRLEVRDAR